MTQTSAPGYSVAGQADNAGYAGDVDASEAWEALKSDPRAVLVDVRTTAEWNFVGVPDLSGIGKEAVLVQWQVFPGMEVNTRFVDEVRSSVEKTAEDSSAPIYFLCRSGARSKAAAIALTRAGHGPCYNISNGFEGPHDGARHRGTVEGWKAAGLPWIQG